MILACTVLKISFRINICTLLHHLIHLLSYLLYIHKIKFTSLKSRLNPLIYLAHGSLLLTRISILKLLVLSTYLLLYLTESGVLSNRERHLIIKRKPRRLRHFSYDNKF